MKKVIEVMKEAAQKEILPRFGRVNLRVKESFGSFDEYATEADKEASKIILEKIRPEFPGSYSEEQLFENRFDYDLVWQFDPLDGTQEFGESLADGYAMHGALLKREGKIWKPINGIIYLPGVDKLWYSDGEELHFICEGSERALPEITRNEIRGYVRKVDPNHKIGNFYLTLGEKLGIGAVTLASGGAGASISDLLEDKINLIIMNYDYTKEWDLAMAEPIIKARGGFICDMFGNEFCYNRKENPPFNRNGYVISVAFKKEEITPEIPKDLLIRKL